MNQRGFTLVEILFALGILAVALLGFHQGQSSAVKMVVRSETMTQAMGLAQMQMNDIELQLKRKSFQNFLEEEKGEFKDERLKMFTWVRKIETVDLGCFMPGASTPEENQESETSGQDAFVSLAQKVFEQAVRKIKVTIYWEEGGQKRELNLTQLYVRFEDLPKI